MSTRRQPKPGAVLPLAELGERRHEQCAFGMLMASVPRCAPGCIYKPDAPLPPGIMRAWSGLVDVERDCAVCPVFRPL